MRIHMSARGNTSRVIRVLVLGQVPALHCLNDGFRRKQTVRKRPRRSELRTEPPCAARQNQWTIWPAREVVAGIRTTSKYPKHLSLPFGFQIIGAELATFAATNHMGITMFADFGLRAKNL